MTVQCALNAKVVGSSPAVPTTAGHVPRLAIEPPKPNAIGSIPIPVASLVVPTVSMSGLSVKQRTRGCNSHRSTLNNGR